MLWWKSPCELVIDKAIIFGKWWLLFTDKFSLYDSPGWLSPWATVRARRKEKKVKEAQRDYRLLTSAGSLPVQLSLKSTATPLTYWDYIITYIHQYYRQYCSATQKVKKKIDSNFYSRNKSTSYCCASSELQEIFAPKKKISWLSEKKSRCFFSATKIWTSVNLDLIRFRNLHTWPAWLLVFEFGLQGHKPTKSVPCM